MNKNIEWIILIAGIVAVFLIIVHGTTGSYYETIYESRIVGTVPAGEITQNFFLEQSIHIPSDFEDTDEINLFILMATYDRYNENNISFTLTQDNFTDEVVLNTKYFRDNSYVRLNFSSKGLREGLAELCIKGLDGHSGNAATAWLTEDTSHGHAVINGRETNRSLVIKYAINTDCPHFAIGGGPVMFSIWCFTYIVVILGFFHYCQRRE